MSLNENGELILNLGENLSSFNVGKVKGDAPIKGVDYFTPEDIDAIYQQFGISGLNTITSELWFNRVPALEENKADKAFVEDQLGDIETALDGIIAIQNELMGVSE